MYFEYNFTVPLDITGDSENMNNKPIGDVRQHDFWGIALVVNIHVSALSQNFEKKLVAS
jgi:hypothetical protein